MMSSESSTEQAPSFRAFHFFVVAALLAATIAVLLARDTTPQNLILMSVAVATAAGVGIAGFRTLAPLLAPDVLEDEGVPHQRRRAGLEREKALVLRSIKDLEFDRAMGKVGDADFEEMGGRLRQRAIGLMKQLDQWDEGEYRTLIAHELETRLGVSVPPLAPVAQPVAARALEAAESPASIEPGEETPAISCNSCGAAASADDVFCRRCGTRLGAPA